MLESYEVLRDNGGCDVGGLTDGFSDAVSETVSDFLSLKLKRALVLVGAGLSIAGDICLRKSK